MSIPIATAVSGAWEANLVSGLSAAGSHIQVARRCADLAELLAVAEAGLIQAAIISTDLNHLDAEALQRLRAAEVAVVALSDPQNPGAGMRIANLGVSHIINADAEARHVVAAVTAAVSSGAAAGTAGSPGGWNGPAGAGAGFGSGGPGVGAGGPGTAGAMPPATYPAGAAGHAAGHPVAAPEVKTAQLQGKIVAVWGPAGAPGRTTVAVTLASELAQARYETLLVDCDTYGPSIAQTLGLLDESAGLTPAVRAGLQGGLDAHRLASFSPLVSSQLRVLTGLPTSARWPELRPAGLDALWRAATQLSAWTVVDCGFCLESDEELSYDTSVPRRNAAALSALAAADVVVVVGACDPIGLQRLIKGLTELSESVVLSAPPITVVNRVRAASVGSPPERKVLDAMQQYAKVSDVVVVPYDQPSCDAALLAGRTLTEHAPASPARQAIAQLAGRLLQVMGHQTPPLPPSQLGTQPVLQPAHPMSATAGTSAIASPGSQAITLPTRTQPASPDPR